MSETQITLYKFTNQKDSPYLDSLLAMFYSGAFRNSIGIMEAQREFEDGKGYPALILVGVAEEDGEQRCYPLAEVIPSEQAYQYLHPDGKGGYIRPETTECQTTQ